MAEAQAAAEAEKNSDAAEGDATQQSESDDTTDQTTDQQSDQTDNQNTDQTENSDGAADNATDNTDEATDNLTAADVLRELLPETLPGTLDLTLSLNPAIDDVDTGNHTVVLPGDTFTVNLPSGLSLTDEMITNTEKGTFDIFQSDAEGNPTTLKIAEGTVENEGTTLKVTFVEPVETADAESTTAYYVGNPTEGTVPATQTEGKEQIEKLDASIDLKVAVKSELLTDEASELTWTLQTKADDENVKQEATLALPGMTELADQLGVVVPAPEEPQEQEGEKDDQTDQTDDETAIPPASNGIEPLALPDEEVSYSLGSINGSLQTPYQIIWCDNNSGSRPDIDSLKSGYVLQYSTDGGKTFKSLTDANGGALTQDAKEDLYLNDSTVDWSSVTVEQTGTNTWTLTNASGLPTQVNKTVKSPVDADGDGQQDYNADGSLAWQTKTTSVYTDESGNAQPIVWRVSATESAQSAPKGYVLGENDSRVNDEGIFTRYFMLTTPVSFSITGKLGNGSLDDMLKIAKPDYFRLSALINNKQVTDGDGNPRYDTLKEMLEKEEWKAYGMTYTFDGDTNTATITGNMPAYDENGYPIVYYVSYAGPQSGQDYYQATYDNSQSASHGSAIDRLYSGGTLTLRHAGTTSYTAKKEWLDGASNEEHPETTFTLWRYSYVRDPDGYLTASQVQLASLKNATNPGSSQISATSYVSITVPASTEDTIDLGQLLREKYGETALAELPKYDPDGYPYVYCLREEGAPSGYEIVFGEYDETTGQLVDTEPSYQNPDGTWNKDLTDRTRPATNPFVYNDGVISNRRTGTVETEVTKTWQIAAFQDQLRNVGVSLQAQSRRVYDESSVWTDVSDENATQTLTDWYAESLTQTVEETFPKYDAAGYELEYRWVETNVTLGDQATNFKADAETGEGTFTLTLDNAEGDPETLEFTSERDGDAITNSFLNETDETVIKLWEQPDGSYAQQLPAAEKYEEAGISTDGVDFSGEATVGLYQDGKLIGAFTLDGKTEESPTKIDNLAVPEGFEEDPTWQETEEYKLEFEHLPKYDENGVRHTYLVLENPITGWDVDRTYDADTRTTTITNSIGPGESSDIRITKQWIDGDDAAHRVDVIVKLAARHHIESDAKDDNGEPLYSYDENDVVPVYVHGEGGPVTEIQIGLDDRWFQEVEIPIGGLTWKDFEVQEVALVDTQNTDDPADDVRYPVVNYAQAQAEETYKGEGWLTSGWDESSDTLRVATEEHVYEVTTTDAAGEPAHNEDLDSLEVTNRRLGLFDLTVTKHWSDSDGSANRPDAEIVVSSPEYPNAFSMNDGKVYVSISNNVLPVVDKEGNQLTDENARVENGALVVKVDKSKTDSEYTFFGLPKYDSSGAIVHYVAEERWAEDGDRGEYSYSSETGEYVIGEQHYHDNQEIKLDNTRGNVRDVVFYKNWHDQYVNDELHQRPDIYLTLYRVTRTVDADGVEHYSDPEKVDGYSHWEWQGVDVEGTGEADASYNQMATIKNLPKYDSEGNEYVYYASESMAADGGSLDYIDVSFDYSTIQAQEADAKLGGENALKVDENAPSNDPTQNGKGWAIHEEGIFVNTVQNELVAKGTKLWENIPGITDQADLPKITIYLQRRLAATTDQTAEEWPELKGARQNKGGEWVFAQGSVAQTSHLVQTATNEYTYTITHEGINGTNPSEEEGKELERYDEYGRRYEYRAVEVVWGLKDQPGGFTLTNDQLENMNFAGEEESELVGKVFTVQHGETGSFLIRNIYQPDEGNLTVKKFFTGRTAGDEYPSLTFDVYRYYLGADGNKSASERVATKTFSGAEIKSMIESGDNGNGSGVSAYTFGSFFTDALQRLVNSRAGGDDANGSFTYTFGNLDIYAPTGDYWQYYVVEHDVNGYTTTVEIGNIDNADNVDRADQDEETADIESPVLNPKDGTPIANDETPDVTFRNNYEEGSGKVKGRKTWNDNNDFFGVRPTVEDFKNCLTFSRTAGGMTEDEDSGFVVQWNDSGKPNYAEIKVDADGSYVFTILNVEEWAPNGIAWTYKVTERLDEDALLSYSMVKATGTVVSTNTNGEMTLTNSLYGQANVVKKWDPAEDEYGLQPTEVTVQLQVNLVEHGKTETPDWQEAVSELAEATGKSKDDVAKTGKFDEKTLSDSNGWRASWSNLPTQVMGKDNKIYDVSYRAVEIKIGEVSVTPPTGYSDAYSVVASYQPSQGTTYPSEGSTHVGTTTITNKLLPLSISATKSWDDENNGWNTRPTTGDTWTVTYLLQRSDDGGSTWEWVLKYGTTHENTEDLFDEDIVSQTITGAGNTATATWDNLPSKSDKGEIYQYRVVERVPGSYDVKTKKAESVLKDDKGNPVSETHNGVEYRYYVVPITTSGSTPSQSFENTLRTVKLQGIKKWEDYKTGLAGGLTIDDMPDLTLYRKAGANGAAEEVEYINSDDGQPKWTDNNDGSFTFEYESLPAANKDDVDYIYWAEEVGGASDGYYPLYGANDEISGTSHDGTGTTNDGKGTQTNETITNTATRFTLDKMSDDADPATTDNQLVQVNGVELALKKDGKTFAVWARNDEGVVSSKVWPSGTDDTFQGGTKMADKNAGYIIGLPAGTYTVEETKTPAGFATAQAVSITIASNGAVTATGDGVQSSDKVENVADAAGTQVIKITVEDQILRGHLALTKYLSDDGAASGELYSDATFSLYSVDLDNDDKPELIAGGLKPVNGQLTTVGNATEINKTSSNPNNPVDLTHGGRYITLADGLPEGTYFFVETSVGPDAVMPDADQDQSVDLQITQNNHYAFTHTTVSTAMGNEVFNANVTLPKYDTTSTDGIADAIFKLEYRAEGVSGSDYPTVISNNLKTDRDGKLTLENLKKGSYRLTEVSNPGYNVTDDNRFTATFVIENEDDDKTFDMTTSSGRDEISFTVTNGTFGTDGTTPDGVPNDRLPGSVALDKTGVSGPMNGAEFMLEVKEGNDWKPLVSGLKTGNTYVMSEDQGTVDTGTPGQDGRITVENLEWGTYRFVETKSTEGHLDPTNANVSGEIKVDRYSLNPSQTGDNTVATMANEPTKLEIVKVGPDGATSLKGAEFTITAIEGSSLADGQDDVLITTNDQGVATLEGQLVVGDTYTLKETKSSGSEYELLDGEVTFEVQPNGELKVIGSLPSGYAKTDGTSNAFSFTVTNQYFKLNIQKTGDSQYAKGEHPFAGAEFILAGADGYSQTFKTVENGSITIISGLKSGVTYSLSEAKAPAGFTPASGTFTFQLDKWGNVVQTSGDAAYSVDNNTVTVTVTNEPTDLTITKLSDDGKTVLPGAEFTVRPATGNDSFEDGASEHVLATTSPDGTASLKGQLVVGCAYIIEETKAPSGYTKIDGFVTVRVANDGSLFVEQNADASQTPTDFVVNGDAVKVFSGKVTNNPTELTLAKVDANTNETIAGVEFELTGEFADGAASKTLVSTKDGVALDKAMLIADGKTEYTLHEVTPPAGYETIADLTFTVAEDGTIKVANENAAQAAGWTWNNTSAILVTAADDPIEIDLVKIGADTSGQEVTTAGTAEFLVKPVNGGAFANGTPEENFNGIKVTTETIANLLKGRLVVDTYYSIEELVAPDGYELVSGTMTFYVNADGTIREIEDTADAYSVSSDGDLAVITATDQPIEVLLAKKGSDSGDTLLGYANFELYKGDEVVVDKIVGNFNTEPGKALKITGLVGGETYTLHERTAPIGYELMPDLTFTVKTDGSVVFADSDAALAAGYFVNESDGVVTITATDEPIEITLSKKDLSGKTGLFGAKFELDGQFADGTNGKKTIDLTASDTVTIRGLVNDHTYTLTETAAPEGYEKLGGFMFTVDAYGKITAAPGSTEASAGKAGYVIEDGNIAITAYDAPIEIELAKRSSDVKTLSGAEFELKGAFSDTKEPSKKVTPGIAITGLIAGEEYTLTETKAPAGYELNTTEFKFTVEPDGTIKAADQTDYSVSDDGITITATDEPVKITLNKAGSDKPAFGLNATFELTGIFANLNDGTVNLEAGPTTREIAVVNGTATIDGLVVGQSYTLSEKDAPIGYELIDGSLTFTVNDDGTISAATGEGIQNSDAIQIGTNGISITATDTPIEIRLSKQAVGSDDPLPGAEFTLSGKFLTGEGKVADESADKTIKLDGKDATALIGSLVVGEEYTLTETKAPAGYEKLGTFTFKVNEQGEIVALGGDGYTVEGNNLTVVANDTPIEARVEKLGEKGHKLPNAEFTITRADDPGDTRTVTTDEDGTAVIDSAWLQAGKTYTINEVTAPEGFELAGSITFKVNEDGTLVIVDASGSESTVAECTDGSGAYEVYADGGTAVIAATDGLIAARLQKNSEDGKPLSGATFELTDKADPASAQALTVNEQGMTALPGLVAGHTYALTETVAPAGYELNTTVFEFTVNADGTITAALDQEGYSFDGTDVITVTATDAPVEVTLTKADLAENALNGAVFSLSGTFANENGTPGSSATRELTLEDNTITIDGLIATREGAEYVYTLTETTAPEGYELLGEFRFTVDEHGAIHAVSAERAEGAAGYDVSDDGLTITAHDQDIQINLSKQDAEGNALDDAAFKLAPAEGSHFADGSTSAVSATPGTPVTGLVAGQTYVLTETVAPVGYEAISGSFTFTVNANGTIAAASAENDPAFAVADDGITIVATDVAIEVGLIKLSADGTQLAEASFSLADADNPDTELATITSTAEGTVAIPGLVAGTTYVLTEIEAPLGYELAEGSFTFTVGADGTISVPDDAENGAAYSHANRGVVTVTVTDEPVEVQIEKLGENSAPLTGATFSLAPAEGSTFANGSTEALTLSTTDGLTSVVSAQLVAGQTYVLTETAAPAGYELIAGSFTFTVGEDGTLAPAPEGNAPAYALGVDAGVITITATDEPVSIELSKTDLSGNALEGAEFTLTGIFANADGTPAAEAETRTVAVDGTTSVSGLIASVEGGTVYEYQLVETVAPAGFELIDGTLSFTVDAQGNLVVDPATVPAGYQAASGTVTVTAQDTPVELTVLKRSESGEALEGAEFTLSGTFADGTAEKDVTPGTPVTDLIAGEKYVLTETVAPAGYEKLGSIELTVADDGTVSGTGAGYEVAADGVTVVATDIAIEARVAKVDENGKPLAGATFTVAAADNPADARTVTTGEDGTATLDAAWLVAGRTYTITEVEAPAGFELAGGASFTVAEDGTVSLVADDGSAAAVVLGKDGSGSYEATVDGRTAVITAADTSIVAQLVKVTGSTPLAGAEFELVPAEGSAFADGSAEARTLEVNANGLTALSGLVAGGTYVLRETVAPAGYELIAGELTFTVGEDGTLTAAEGAPEAYVIAERGGVITIVADDAPIEVTLSKTDLSGNALTGAEFTLRGEFANADGTPASTVEDRTVTVDENGSATLTGLVAGTTYTLTESVAPAGHELAGSFSFTVAGDGTISVAEGSAQAAEGAAGYRIGADGITLVASDAPVEARLVKTSVDGTPLAGAEFTLTPAEGAAFADGSTNSVTLTTGEDGTAALPAAQLVAGEKYVLTETVAPEGYELAGSATLVVAADGTLTLAEGAPESFSVSADGGMAQVTVADELTELTVYKVDGNGEPLAGAEFTLTEARAWYENLLPIIFGEAESFSAVSDETGKVTFTGLVAGKSYVLAETAAPVGYELVSDTLTVTVAADGTVSVAEGATLPAAFTLGADGVSITVVNQAVGVTLVKQDLEGHALAGAEFTLTGSFPDGSTSMTFTSDELGLVFGELQLAGSEEGTPYVLTETSAPEGYELLIGPVTLLVFADGTLSLAADTPADLREMVSVDNGSGTAIVVVSNEPTPEPTIPGTGDEPEPGDPNLPTTGDPIQPALPVMLAVSGTALVGLGLLGRRRRQNL